MFWDCKWRTLPFFFHCATKIVSEIQFPNPFNKSTKSACCKQKTGLFKHLVIGLTILIAIFRPSPHIYTWYIFIIFSNISETTDLLNHTTMFIGFKDVTCLRYRRSVFMTWDNFLGKKTELQLFINGSIVWIGITSKWFSSSTL